MVCIIIIITVIITTTITIIITGACSELHEVFPSIPQLEMIQHGVGESNPSSLLLRLRDRHHRLPTEGERTAPNCVAVLGDGRFGVEG